MTIAISSKEGRVFPDCGLSGQFTLVELDQSTKTVRQSNTITTSPVDTLRLAGWLRDQGVELVIAGGLRREALDALKGNGIRVLVGAPSFRVEALVARFLTGTLETPVNAFEKSTNASPLAGQSN